MSNTGALKALTDQIRSAAIDAMSEAESKIFLDALSNLSDAYSGGDPEACKQYLHQDIVFFHVYDRNNLQL